MLNNDLEFNDDTSFCLQNLLKSQTFPLEDKSKLDIPIINRMLRFQCKLISIAKIEQKLF